MYILFYLRFSILSFFQTVDFPLPYRLQLLLIYSTEAKEIPVGSKEDNHLNTAGSANFISVKTSSLETKRDINIKTINRLVKEGGILLNVI